LRNIRLEIQYDGSGYHGWQRQSGAPTIQETLCSSIAKITGQSVCLTAAGRTDAGVHALGQVATFRTSSRLTAETLRRALNALLPQDIRIAGAAEASEGFHPRYQALSKRYFYLIWNEAVVPPFLRRFVWGVPYVLNREAMRECLPALIGRHDFSAFRGSGCGAMTTTRTICSLTLDEADRISFMTATLRGALLKVTVEADGFLRHMVRNLVGTLVEVGRGRMEPRRVEEILRAGDRSRAGPTAPPQGLFLESVRY
jgi:tRNA pseudouridine38-40 synthase